MFFFKRSDLLLIAFSILTLVGLFKRKNSIKIAETLYFTFYFECLPTRSKIRKAMVRHGPLKSLSVLRTIP
jgi:hypothetical protein